VRARIPAPRSPLAARALACARSISGGARGAAMCDSGSKRHARCRFDALSPLRLVSGPARVRGAAWQRSSLSGSEPPSRHLQ
jgi:hypothetical protein